MAKNREGRDLLSDTPQDSDLKTYSAPNREGWEKMSAFYLVNVFTRLKWALPLYWSVRRFLQTFIVCK